MSGLPEFMGGREQVIDWMKDNTLGDFALVM